MKAAASIFLLLLTSFTAFAETPGSIRMTLVNPDGSTFAELYPSSDVLAVLKAADNSAIRSAISVSASAVLPTDYTVATLPSASANARKYAWVTDLFGAVTDLVLSNGTNWIPVRPSYTASLASGNMTLTPLASPTTVIFTGSIGTGVTHTVTLSTTNAYRGARFIVARKASGLGTLLVNALGINLNTGAMFEYDGTAWVQVLSGGLL